MSDLMNESVTVVILEQPRLHRVCNYNIVLSDSSCKLLLIRTITITITIPILRSNFNLVN